MWAKEYEIFTPESCAGPLMVSRYPFLLLASCHIDELGAVMSEAVLQAQLHLNAAPRSHKKAQS